MKSLQSILDAVKLNPKYLFGIMVFTGTLLYIGNGGYLNDFGFSETLYEKSKVWISLTLILAASMFISHIIFFLFEKSKVNYKWHVNMRALKKKLHVLTNIEKEILRYYIDNNENSQLLSYVDGNVKELEQWKIIYRASTLSARGRIFPYNLQPWAREYLIENRHLLK